MKADFNCTTNEQMLSNRPPSYFLNGVDITGQHSDLELTHVHNNAKLYCLMYLNNAAQTEISSATQVLNVTYRPYNVKSKLIPTKTHHETSKGFLLNSTQNVDVSCTANANPTIHSCVWNSLNNQLSDKCNTSFFIGMSLNVTCTAFNNFGNLSTEPIQLIVVEQRNAVITSNNQPSSINEGKSLTLFCNVEFEKELGTTYLWEIPSQQQDIILDSQVLNLSNVSQNDKGKYKCSTKDDFGLAFAEIEIDILYEPHDVTATATTSDVIIESESTILLNSVQIVTMHCVSDANPTAICNFNIDGETTPLDGMCELEREFSQSANVTCTASNEINNVTSLRVQVVVVPPRQDVGADLSPTNSQPIAGDDLILDCGIPYYDELGTTFHWTIPSEQRDIGNDSVLKLNDLNRFDLGTYTCTTIDTFGETSRSIFIDIYYAPEETQSNTLCKWKDVTSDSCFVSFTSNPSAEGYTVTHNGSIFECLSCRLEYSPTDKYGQVFYLVTQESSKASSTYQVRIKSRTFADLIVEFTVQTDDVNPPANQTGLIVGCVVGGVAAIAIVLVIVVCKLRKGKKTGQKEKSISHITIRNISNDDIDVGPTSQHPVGNFSDEQLNAEINRHYVNATFDKQDIENKYELPSNYGDYEIPLTEEHKYAEIRNRKGSYETTILPFEAAAS